MRTEEMTHDDVVDKLDVIYNAMSSKRNLNVNQILRDNDEFGHEFELTYGKWPFIISLYPGATLDGIEATVVYDHFKATQRMKRDTLKDAVYDLGTLVNIRDSLKLAGFAFLGEPATDSDIKIRFEVPAEYPTDVREVERFLDVLAMYVR